MGQIPVNAPPAMASSGTPLPPRSSIAPASTSASSPTNGIVQTIPPAMTETTSPIANPCASSASTVVSSAAVPSAATDATVQVTSPLSAAAQPKSSASANSIANIFFIVSILSRFRGSR